MGDGLYEFASRNKLLTHVTIELTTNCNWRCKHCFIEDYKAHNLLTIETLDDIFYQLRELGVIDLLLTGGEIFIRSDICEIIKLAREYFFGVSLFTNVSLMTEDQIKKISEYGVSLVSCTIFSMDQEIHDKFSQKEGSLERVLINLELLKKYNIPVEVKHIITKENPNEYLKIQAFCDENSFHFMGTTSIFPRRSNNYDNLQLAVGEDYLRTNIGCIDMLRNFSSVNIQADNYACNATRYSLFIQANGTISPCSMLCDDIGNVFLDRIEEVWKHNKFLAYVQELRHKDLNCYQCENVKVCNHCSGVAKQESGDLLGCCSLEKKIASVRNELKEEYEMYKKETYTGDRMLC